MGKRIDKTSELQYCMLVVPEFCGEYTSSEPMVMAWLNRVVGPDRYEHLYDYYTQKDKWRMCLTPGERAQLKRYLDSLGLLGYTLKVIRE